MNSPYRAHPAPQSAAPPAGKTIPFPAGNVRPQDAPSVPAQQPADDGATRLVKLVTLEGAIRDLPDAAAVVFHAVNDARGLIAFRQGWFLRRNRRGRFVTEAVSDVPAIDLNAPLVLDVTKLVNGLAAEKGPQAVDLSRLQDGRYPLANGLLLPLSDRTGRVFAILLLAREQPWPEATRTIALRLAGTYAHALQALTPPSLLRTFAVPRWAMAGVPLVAALLALVPVPMTALAPFEVVAHEPQLVTAPLDGVIAAVDADANTPVQAGTLLFRLDDTRVKAEAVIAAQKVQVAASRLATARNGAFEDADLKRALAVTEQELHLAQAERDYAESLEARSHVHASESGLLIYSSRNDLVGKPVRAGEKVMEIADPQRIAYRIELAVGDSITLGQGGQVWLFFDADPLRPRAAQLTQTSYHAQPTAEGGLAYVLRARPADRGEPMRIGLRGTAQIAGGRVPLGFYLLRRPIAALRQHFGW